ncbi:3,4-dihydroxy-9,10-secoandrosta-1,3,5(10)-triene-9,17-dione 4,5-dioxygenase [Rhodococcus sp. OK519]|uniref:VOC family protein n=1 Tax=Rhodococcus sp. OK519 TaxID=2135729 RepID=UPI000D33CD1E|nr:3,4-dihydroxy-9,10-secoandrosta-1,3,5(10)-triene-9,17-dione 4,5-dioxygenase [Rhodococcus sp. OK519]
MPVLSLGYLRLGVESTAQWKSFADDFLGMMPVDGPLSGALHYRMDDYPPRLVVAESAAPGLDAVGFEVLDRSDLREIVGRVEAAGVETHAGSAEECALRQVTGFAAFDDPSGNRVELFYGPVLSHRPVDLPHVSGFVTGDQGMGHVILNATDTEAAYEFYVGVLGFVERNSLQLPGGISYFLGCNPRQHTLGLNPADGPALLHFMIETESIDDVGKALDRAETLGIPMMQSLGKHTNDRMLSFYVYSPEGHATEIGWGGERIEGAAPTYRITEGAIWGHRYTPPPAGAKGLPR